MSHADAALSCHEGVTADLSGEHFADEHPLDPGGNAGKGQKTVTSVSMKGKSEGQASTLPVEQMDVSH